MAWIKFLKKVEAVEGTTLDRVVDWVIEFDNEEVYSLSGQRDGKYTSFTGGLIEAVARKFPFLELKFYANFNNYVFDGTFSTSKNILPKYEIKTIGTMDIPKVDLDGWIKAGWQIKDLEHYWMTYIEKDYTQTISSLNDGLEEILQLCGYQKPKYIYKKDIIGEWVGKNSTQKLIQFSASVYSDDEVVYIKDIVIDENDRVLHTFPTDTELSVAEQIQLLKGFNDPLLNEEIEFLEGLNEEIEILEGLKEEIKFLEGIDATK